MYNVRRYKYLTNKYVSFVFNIKIMVYSLSDKISLRKSLRLTQKRFVFLCLILQHQFLLIIAERKCINAN